MKALVIPAYQPSEALLDLLQTISAASFAAIIVVDDGSGSRHADLFSRAAAMPNVHIVRHAFPIGRGAAIRTGIHAALAAAPDLNAVVIAETCHSAAAIEQISRQQDALVLGIGKGRRPGIVTKLATLALVGRPLAEPETSLRSIPAALLPHLLRMESHGAEFDLEMLLVADQHAIPIVEQPLDTRMARARSWWNTSLALIRFAAKTRPRRAVGFAFALVAAAIFLGAMAAEIHGFATGHLFNQTIWLPWGQRRLGRFAALFGAGSLPLLLIVPWAYASVSGRARRRCDHSGNRSAGSGRPRRVSHFCLLPLVRNF